MPVVTQSIVGWRRRNTATAGKRKRLPMITTALRCRSSIVTLPHPQPRSDATTAEFEHESPRCTRFANLVEALRLVERPSVVGRTQGIPGSRPASAAAEKGPRRTPRRASPPGKPDPLRQAAGQRLCVVRVLLKSPDRPLARLPQHKHERHAAIRQRDGNDLLSVAAPADVGLGPVQLPPDVLEVLDSEPLEPHGGLPAAAGTGVRGKRAALL